MTVAPTPQKDPLPPLLLALSAVTGLLDAASVLGMGKVFTANMTGNVVFLGFAVAGAPGFEAPRFIAALAAFLGGAWLGGLIARRSEGAPLRTWLLRIACLEAGLFWAAAALAWPFDIDTLTPAWSLYAMIAMTAFAMGLRNATARLLKVADMTTTVLTLTLTGLAADSHWAGGNNANWQRRLASVGAIFIGAVVGAVLVLKTGIAIPLLLAGAVVIVATLAYAAHPASHTIARTAKA